MSTTGSESAIRNGTGKARWKILRSAIVDKKLISGGDFISSHSVRRFNTFELFVRKQCNCANKSEKGNKKKEACCWFAYTCKDILRSKEVWIQHPKNEINFKEATAFNNTGNVCIWPAEEVLAYYCILHSDKFNFKSIVELGGGSSGLAGMCIAVNAKSPKKVLLTDGNAKCVASLKRTVEINTKEKSNVNLSACILRWDDPKTYRDYANAFDYVICADCLFFDEFRQNLADTIHFILKPSGVALIFAPKRGKTLGEFIAICREKFSNVSQSDQYCQSITSRHMEEELSNELYNPDIHFPHLVELVK